MVGEVGEKLSQGWGESSAGEEDRQERGRRGEQEENVDAAGEQRVEGIGVVEVAGQGAEAEDFAGGKVTEVRTQGVEAGEVRREWGQEVEHAAVRQPAEANVAGQQAEDEEQIREVGRPVAEGIRAVEVAGQRAELELETMTGSTALGEYEEEGAPPELQTSMEERVTAVQRPWAEEVSDAAEGEKFSKLAEDGAQAELEAKTGSKALCEYEEEVRDVRGHGAGAIGVLKVAEEGAQPDWEAKTASEAFGEPGQATPPQDALFSLAESGATLQVAQAIATQQTNAPSPAGLMDALETSPAELEHALVEDGIPDHGRGVGAVDCKCVSRKDSCIQDDVQRALETSLAELVDALVHRILPALLLDALSCPAVASAASAGAMPPCPARLEEEEMEPRGVADILLALVSPGLMTETVAHGEAVQVLLPPSPVPPFLFAPSSLHSS